MVLNFVFCVIIEMIDFKIFKQIGMQQANALNSIGYTETVLFITIGKPDIYLLKV
jgi:hypothetical protein